MRRAAVMIFTGLIIGATIGLCLFMNTSTYQTKESSTKQYDRTIVSTDNGRIATPRYRTPTPKWKTIIGPYQFPVPVPSYQTNKEQSIEYTYRTYLPHIVYRTNGSKTIYIR